MGTPEFSVPVLEGLIDEAMRLKPWSLNLIKR